MRMPRTQLFHDAFDKSPVGIVVENLEGQLLFVNPAFCSMLGFSEEELRSKHCVDFSPREDAEKDWALFQQLRAGSIDHYQLEKRYFRRDGSLVWGRLIISLLNAHPSPLVLAIAEDVTEKKFAEEARFRHAAIVESSEDAIASATLDGVIVSWNSGAHRMYGYTEAEVVGKSVTVLLPPELGNEEKQLIATVTAGGRIEHYETIRVTKTGKKINISLTISPIKDSSGTIVGLSGIARDITDRKKAEEALAEMTRKLIESQERERSRIARELHDDINQRLALLANELRLLGNDPSEIQQGVQKLVQRTVEISNDVQALSHELHSAKLEYLGVVTGIRGWCREFGERQGMEINFKTDVTSRVPPEIGLSLFRILQEALHNAAKHSGVKCIEVKLTEHRNEVALTVSDAGKGFEVEEARQGTGLGLASMEERVRLVNGTIAIESKPMGGTIIRVKLPLNSELPQRAVG